MDKNDSKDEQLTPSEPTNIDIQNQVEQFMDDPIVNKSGQIEIDDNGILSKPEDPTVKEDSNNIKVSQDDKETDKIVEDIIKDESDIVIKAHDEKVAQFSAPPKKPKGLKRFFGAWWHNKLARWLTILVVVGGLAAVFIIPTTRYFILNKIGVRSSMTVQVIDAKSGRPVKNVETTVQGQKVLTNEQGNASFNNLLLGTTDMLLAKRSFATETIPVTVGWGSNPFGSPFEITPTGTKFRFTVQDWLTGSPLAKATVSDGESEAVTNEKGEAELTIEPTDNDIVATVSADMYLSKSVTIPANSEESQQVQLVPSKKDIFLSNRSGKISVYSRYIDNTEELVLLAGTGNEQDSTQLLAHPSKDIAILSSSRDGKRDSKGAILSALYLIDANSKQVEQISDSSSNNIRIVGWVGDSIVYVLGNGATVDNPTDQQKLVAFNSATGQVKELAKSAYFGDVKIADNNVYYVTSALDQAQTGAGLSVIAIDGSRQKVLIDKPIWSVNRINQSQLIVNAQEDKWYQVNIPNNDVKNLEGRPPLVKDYQFITNPYAQNMVYVDVRDGKGTILLNDVSTQDKPAQEIVRQSGLQTMPLRWITPTVILYSVNTPQESANYVVDTQVKKSLKVGDVTNTGNGDFR
ncbi:MAG: hypothetical protein QG562_481 [Patescibacteria group bacterium]|nr:hypothetical protein [Patescibacteria group bacterium]